MSCIIRQKSFKKETMVKGSKKIVMVILTIAICFVMTGCYSFIENSYKAFSKENYKFLHENSEISFIEIVKIGEIEKVGDEMLLGIFVESEIQDEKSFLDDFSNVECYRKYSDPRGPRKGSLGIKITYSNGDYEIICASGQSECENGIFYYERGAYSFDNEQFDLLLKKYII